MSDSGSDGMGDMQAGPAPDSQTTMAQANAAQTFGNGKLTEGTRQDRDVSRPKDYRLKRGSSTRDQCSGGQP